MGSRFGTSRVFNRLYKTLSSSGSQGPVDKCRQRSREVSGHGKGGSRTLGKRGYRTSKHGIPRVLLGFLSGSQKRRRDSSHFELASTEQVCSISQVHDGDKCVDSTHTSEGRLVSQSRSQRCVFSCGDYSKSASLSPVRFCQQGLSVQMPAFRSIISPPCIHEDVSSYSRSNTRGGHQVYSISRRLSADSVFTRNFKAECSQGNIDIRKRRIYDKLEEVVSSAMSKSEVSGHEDRHFSRSGISSGGQSLGDSSMCKAVHSSLLPTSQVISQVVGADSGLPCVSTFSSLKNAPDPALFSVGLEGEHSQCVQKDSSSLVSDPIFRVLADEEQSSTRCTFDNSYSPGNCDDRRMQHGVGRSLKRVQSSRPLVSKSTQSPHKLSGNVGSTLHSSSLCSSTAQQGCFDSNRQYKRQVLYKQVRGNRVISTVCSGNQTTSMVQDVQNSSHSRVCPRGREHFGRHVIQEDSQSDRVVTQTFRDSSSLQALASTSSGLVRHCREQTNSGVLQLDVPGRGISCGRSDNVLVRSSSVCIPSTSTVAQGTMQSHAGATVVHSVNSSQLAQQIMVSSYSAVPSGPSSTVASAQRSVNPTQRQTVSCKPGRLVPGSMANKRNALVASGLSEQVARTILASRAESTYRAYESGWRHYDSWCRRKGFDPFTSTVAVILRFLQYCLKTRGLSHSSIKNRVFSIALYHISFPLEQLSCHPWVKAFLKGAKRLCPVMKDVLPVWDLQFVLNALLHPPFEPMLTTRLDWLTWKTVFLVAITTAKRIGEIKALSAVERYTCITPAGIRLRLNPYFIPKVNSQANREAEMFLEPFCPRSDPRYATSDLYKLCPCRAIKKYIEATAVIRRTDQLFICYGNGPSRGGPAHKTTIARWVRKGISEAYLAQNKNPPQGLKAHQTRAQAATWAQFNNTTMHDILKSATWASECTFATFYRLNLAGTESTANFGTNVLNTVFDRH